MFRRWNEFLRFLREILDGERASFFSSNVDKRTVYRFLWATSVRFKSPTEISILFVE